MYRKGLNFVIRVPLRNGRAVALSTGTPDKRVAEAMQRMVETLADRREFDLLDALHGGDQRGLRTDKRSKRASRALTLGGLYDAYRLNQHDALRENLSDVDLGALVPKWQEWLKGKLGADAETAPHYLAQVRTLIHEGERFPRSEFNPRRISAWLNGLTVSTGTRRKYHAAMSSFAKYLVTVAEVIPANPVSTIPAPKPGAPRRRFLELEDVIRLVEAQPSPYREFSAILHGTGAEVSAGLRIRRADVDKAARTIRLRGTKTHSRDRIAYVSEWCWVYVEKACANLTPGALLFDGVTYGHARRAHMEACTTIGEMAHGIRQHDARHHWAVRAIRAGASLEVIAAQLGHSSVQMVLQVYGRYVPSRDERQSWEKIAAVQDAARQRNA